jgi:dihydrofolate reductase
MRPKISVYIAASLDGFIARPDGNIDWLTDPAYNVPGEDFGYQAFMQTVDVLVVGRNTFEKVLTFGDWPYPDKKVIVLTHAQNLVPDKLIDKVEVLALPPAELAMHLAEQGYQHTYLDGGLTIQEFLRANLVDELTITRIPILLGEGLPLFGKLPGDSPLRHLRTTAFPNGFVQSVYAIGA